MMNQSIKASFLNQRNDAILDNEPTINLSLFLIIVFFFLFNPLVFASSHSHGFYFASPVLQNLCIILEILLPSISIILLLKAPRTICSVYALWILVPSNFVYLCALLLVISTANSSLDTLSINQFETSSTVRKKLGNVTVGMSSVPILPMGEDKGEQNGKSLQVMRLWIERPVFSGLLREFKMLSGHEVLEAKLSVLEEGQTIELFTRNFYGQPAKQRFNSIDWNSAPD